MLPVRVLYEQRETLFSVISMAFRDFLVVRWWIVLRLVISGVDSELCTFGIESRGRSTSVELREDSGRGGSFTLLKALLWIDL